MFSTLHEWLTWLNSEQTERYVLGLDRVYAVGKTLDILKPKCPVITVAGTNGKGSTVETLSSIYQAAGYKTGVFTSPVLLRHNEQVRINGQEASDQDFVDAFNQVDKAKSHIKLTPFEYQTLAALIILQSEQLDVMILEVGLGGRLDAVNVIDPTISVVTTIDLDHCDYLGTTREDIAKEKAGIFRQGIPAVCGDPNPPQTLLAIANQLAVPLNVQGKTFSYKENEMAWDWYSRDEEYKNLPKNALAIQNLSTVLMVVTLMQTKLPVVREDIEIGLNQVRLVGRVQVIQKEITEIYDVAHNVQAISRLAQQLKNITHSGKTIAVFSMLKDKDITKALTVIKDDIDTWYVAPVEDRRAASQLQLKEAFQETGIKHANFCTSISDAFQAAKGKARMGDRVVIFGSFKTVAEVMRYLTETPA